MNLSIIHLNIRSISSNIDEFIAYLATIEVDFDVICLSETWLNSDKPYDCYFPGYKSFHSMRSNRRGGGVAI